MTALKAADFPIFTGEVDEYGAAIAAWTKSLLDPYLEWLKGPGSGRRTSKQFNDPVWGTIVLQPQETVVLDSPLVQRLRRIRQLGVVHLVYPGANHTRFEHSLGVTHQVAQLAQSLNNADGEGPEVIDGPTIDILRLAGLLHDVGHGLMSHVVENGLAGEDSSEKLRIEFGRQIRRSSKPQLSEMAAYFMIASPAVEDLLSLAYAASTKQPPAGVASIIARIVIGKNVSDELPILHELISGPFDADKLDYMPRDAKMCGVPVVTDVVRLVQKVRAVTVSSENLPTGMTGIQARDAGHKVFGVARSGASALDEVSLNRSLMFDKVYRHHKVRSVESMLGAAIQILHPLWGSMAGMMPLKVMDDQFVEFTADDLKRLNGAQGNPVSEIDLAVAADIVQRIRERHLFARAFAFAVTMPGDAYRDDGDHEAASEEFVRVLDNSPEKRQAFIAEIVKIVNEITNLVGDRVELDRIGLDNLHHYIRVDPPSAAGRGSQSDQSRAYLVDESGMLLPVEKARGENRAWADAYVNTKDVGFIFCPRELSDVVHIAAEVAALTLYNVRIPAQMHNYAKKGGVELVELRRQLHAKSFYEGRPRDLEPLPELFNMTDAKQHVAGALQSLRGYMGPTHRTNSPGPSGSTLNETKVLRWAAQFPPEHQIKALRVAQAVRMLDRDEANRALKAFSEAHPDFAGAMYVPLGELKDGSTIMGYHLRDSDAHTGYELSDVVNAIRSEKPIIFVDDFVGLGRSSSGIFRTYMGHDGGADLNEVRTTTLTEDEQARLKERKIAFVWVAGFEAGAQETLRITREFGIEAEHYIHTDAAYLPTVQKALSDLPPEEIAAFVEVARGIGRQLLEAKTAPEKLEERLFGYGNFGLLLTTSYNTPSVTLTAMTHDGEVDDREWNALLPRRKKT